MRIPIFIIVFISVQIGWWSCHFYEKYISRKLDDIWHEWCYDEKECPYEAENEE